MGKQSGTIYTMACRLFRSGCRRLSAICYVKRMARTNPRIRITCAFRIRLDLSTPNISSNACRQNQGRAMIEGFKTVLAASEKDRRDLFVGTGVRLGTIEQNI